jgi:hypothetical protein
MTPEDIRQVAEESAKKAVRELLLTLGVDASKSDEIRAMQRDFAHLRIWRESVDTMRTKGLLVAAGIIVSGIAGAVWMAVRGH